MSSDTKTGFSSTAQSGKLYACVCCGKTPVIGTQVYMQDVTNNQSAISTFKQNFPTITKNPNAKGQIWIACMDIECFKRQGGVYDPSKPQRNSAKSIETRLNQVAFVRREILSMAEADALKMIPPYTDDPNLTPDKNRYNQEERSKSYRITMLALLKSYTIGFSA